MIHVVRTFLLGMGAGSVIPTTRIGGAGIGGNRLPRESQRTRRFGDAQTVFVSGVLGLAYTGEITLNYGTGLQEVAETLVVKETEIDHDALRNFAANEHFTEVSIDHVNIQSIGTKTHAQIDTHLALTKEHIDWTDASDNFKTTGTITAGASTFGDGGGTNYASVSATGDLVFLGTAGLVFGHCYGHHIGWTQASAAQDTWYNIADADVASGNLHGVTHDGNGKLTVTEPGMYLVTLDVTFQADTANIDVDVGIEINGSGAAVAGSMGHIETKFANKDERISVTTILDLADNDYIEASIMTGAAGTPDLTVDCLLIMVTQIGGT